MRNVKIHKMVFVSIVLHRPFGEYFRCFNFSSENLKRFYFYKTKPVFLFFFMKST